LSTCGTSTIFSWAGRADVGALRDVDADDFGPQGRTDHRGEQQNGKRRLSHPVKYRLAA
jgi:hypothetical protein